MGTHWMLDDYVAGNCAVDQVGSPKPPVTPDDGDELPPELARVPAAVLKRDAMAAYKRLGGPQYLAENPHLLAKVLLRLLPAEQQIQQQTDVRVTIDWATESRLSYQRAEVIDNAADPSDNAPWKEPAPDAQTAVAVRALVDSIPRPK